MNDKVRELALKIKALADRGVGGEKINAQKQLRLLCKKHKIKLKDLDSENFKLHGFSYKTNLHLRFISQVLSSCIIGYKKRQRFFKNKPKQYIVELTDAEYIEAAAKVDFFWLQYNKDIEAFYIAFVSVNKLFALEGKLEEERMTEEEKRLRAKAEKMAYGMDKYNFTKLLTSGTPNG